MFTSSGYMIYHITMILLFSSLYILQCVLVQDLVLRSHIIIKEMLMADSNQQALVQTQDMQLTVWV